MKSIGKTYLIEAIRESESIENGIIIPDSSDINDIFYKGIIRNYGTGWTEDEIKNLIPIGTKVIMKYGNKSDRAGIKVVIKDKIYYIYDEDHVIGILEDE